MLRDFDFLADLHLVVVFELYLKVGGSDAPRNAPNDLVKGLQRGYPDPEVARQQQYLVDLVEAGVVLGVVVKDLRHL